MDAPAVDELLNEPAVLAALDDAWTDSAPLNPTRRHEEGGWIYVEVATGAVLVRRAHAGSRALIDLSEPELLPGCVVVATFHTHPNPVSDGWNPGPSAGDTRSAIVLGVPCIIRAEDGIHTTGPASRRGGLGGPAGYPA